MLRLDDSLSCLFHSPYPTGNKKSFGPCLFQVRVFRQQVAVGSVGVGALGGADHLEIFDLHRFVAGPGLNYEEFIHCWADGVT